MSYIHDFQSAALGGVSISPGSQQSGDGSTNGSSVDLKGSEGQVHALVLVGASSEYDTYNVTLKLQESADGASGWSDIDGSSVETNSLGSGSSGENDDKAVLLSAKNRSKRYVRTVATVSGSEASSGASPTVELASYVFAQDGRY